MLQRIFRNTNAETALEIAGMPQLLFIYRNTEGKTAIDVADGATSNYSNYI